MAKGETTPPRAASGGSDAATSQPCGCPYARDLLHDELLGMETAGFDLFEALFDGWATFGSNSEGDVPGIVDFEDFVACHNWHDPVRMHLFAITVTDTVNWLRQTALSRAAR